MLTQIMTDPVGGKDGVLEELALEIKVEVLNLKQITEHIGGFLTSSSWQPIKDKTKKPA